MYLSKNLVDVKHLADILGKILLPLSSSISAASAAKSLQSCLTLCDPREGSPPGFPIPGILQARTLEWVAVSFSNAWKWKVKVKSLSCSRLLETPWTAAYQAPLSVDFPGKSTGVGCHCLLNHQNQIEHSKNAVFLIMFLKFSHLFPFSLTTILYNYFLPELL